MKRAFDLVFSILGLVLLSPLLLFLALLIKVTSKGPVLFAQERAGRDGQPFRIFKFRSMVVNAEAIGQQLTIGADRRITPVGRILRASKLDEFPQLWNVICGDMSLVGPRPEVMKFVQIYTPEQCQVLRLKPGITDPASFAFYNESELLARAPDPERYYRDYLMGEKIRINLDYAAKATLWTDFVLIVATVTRAGGVKLNIFSWLQIREPDLGRGLY